MARAASRNHRRALAELDRRRSDIEQRRVQANTRLQQRTLAAEEFRLRAPITCSLSSLADLSVGQLLRAGQSIGSIQAHGPVRVEARFEPTALGHIKPDQKARVRLDGFAWTDYGALDARVERVAAAVQSGRVLVQLAIEGKVPPGLPLLHHLPAGVEIATGRKTPWQLLLHRAGGWPGAVQERQMAAAGGLGAAVPREPRDRRTFPVQLADGPPLAAHERRSALRPRHLQRTGTGAAAGQNAR